MKLKILSDAHWESGLEKVSKRLSSTGYRTAFESKDYGSGLKGVVVILMCRDPVLHFKQRIRFAKKENTLYLDVMLDLEVMRAATDKARMRIVCIRLADEVPEIVQRYSFQNFDEEQFISDFKSWLNQLS
jgi:hypothetical protein